MDAAVSPLRPDLLVASYQPVHWPVPPLARAQVDSSVGAEVHVRPAGLLRSTSRPRWSGKPAPRIDNQRCQQPRRDALIVGGGLAGCAAAWALAQQGWSATVIDRQAAPAQETSGNPAGLMHGIFTAPDGLHARWYRAAALHTAGWAREPLAQGCIHGALNGLMRLESRRSGAQALAQLQDAGWPPEWLRWAPLAEATAASGLDLTAAMATGAWRFGAGGAGGWLSPVDCCRWWLDEAQRLAGSRWLGDEAVERIDTVSTPQGPLWRCLRADGSVIAAAPVLVLASALQTPALLSELSTLQGPIATPALPLQAVRGQTTLLPADWPGLRAPRSAIAGQGYAVTLPDGRVLCGATSQADDPCSDLRAADHRYNLERAQALGVLARELAPHAFDSATAAVGTRGGTHLGAQLDGRVGWRALTADRLPVVGAPVDLLAEAAARAAHHRLDAVRHRPRLHGLHALGNGAAQRHGLYVLTGLGSRGITSASLAAEVLASWITGAPCPVDRDLRDAIDIGRY